MKIQLTLLIILGAFLTLNAQESASSLYFHGGVGVGYRTVDFGRTQLNQFTNRERFERPGLSWSGGVSIGKPLGRRLRFRTGFRLVNSAYQTNEEFSISVRSGGFSSDGTAILGGGTSVFSGSFGTCSPLSSFCPVTVIGGTTTLEDRRNEFHINFRQLEVPFLLRYEISERRIKPFAEIGISANYLLFSRYYEVWDGRKQATSDRELVGPGRWGVGLNFSLGVSYGLNRNIDLFAQPTMRTTLTPVAIGRGELTEKPRSVLLELGIRKMIYN